MRKFIVLAALCVAGIVGSTSEASAFGWRKKKNDCCEPVVVALPVVSQSTCGCGYGSIGYGTVGSSYGTGYHGGTYYHGSGYPYSSSMGYWNTPYHGGTMYGYPGGFGGYRYYR